MLITRIILAVLAVGALVAAPRSSRAAAVVLGAAAVDVALGAAAGPAVAVVAPLVAFLAAALTLAGLVERSGLAERAAAAIARLARGRGLRLYALVCVVCALLTAAISLDGAVVLIVPLLLALRRRAGAPFAPLFLGAVVANVVSIAVPQGNPTNLVVMSRLGLSPADFVAHMLAPGLIAAGLCAVAVAIANRTALRGAIRGDAAAKAEWTADERRAAIALAAAALTAWITPLAGIAPWWPFTTVVAVAVAAQRTKPVVPWRIAAQVGGLVVVTQALNLPAPVPHSLGLGGFVALTAVVGAASAIANNLPVSVWASSLLASGTSAYAATIGLAVGALATPQGSVATLIAAELAGPCAPKLSVRRLAPLAAAALVVAAATLWAGPS